ncbi:MAG TPA: four helix bundle protein [Ignavibacteria bacterium]|jgi:four helix bundle protein|nr:four helix bundle protein [Ignavibacteria bacterium]
MTSTELKQRTKKFAIRVIEFVDNLPKRKKFDVIAYQILRSSTSIGANYRAACRARSKAEFLAKLGIVEEEADETIYWLELIKEILGKNNDKIQNEELDLLLKEADELTAIFTKAAKTMKMQIRNAKS